MAKDRKKLLHIHSSIPDKQPTAASLEVGEIAVNNAANQEFISLKNSNNKVVRLSSDEQIVSIMEKKEVMPYDGYVRGETGPSGTEDGYGSYGITEDDLLNNTSNIVIKLNQVAASNTVKHDEVNGAKDRYNKCVNPTSDGGLTDGAGFYIDMSRYAMQGANPTFSGITNTCYTKLNGTTTIKGTDGACGSLLDIDVATENGKITTATNTIGTATTNITDANTIIGTANTTITSANTTATTINTTATTINNVVDNFNITGDTYISGDITIGTQCSGLTSTTIADSFCEIISRGNLTIEENHNPSDTSLAAIYTFYQNGKKVTNSAGTVVEIEVAKDKVLKSAEVVKNTSGEWVIRLTWITYDPDTQTSTETTTDVPASELVKDIDAVDTPAVNLDIWYDAESGNQKISADTTITIAAAGGNKTFSKSNATHTLNAYKLSYNHNGFSGEFDPFTANSSFTSPHSALTIDYGVDVTSKNDDTYDTSAAKTVSIPTAVSHINRGKLTVTHNGLSDTFDPATDKSLTFPHSALTVTYETTSGKSGSVTYNTSGAQSISIPTSVSHLNRGTLSYNHNGASGTFDATSNVTLTSPHSALTLTYGATSGQSGSVSYDTSAGKTAYIPTSVSHLNRGKLTIQKNGTTIGTYDPGEADKTINITSSPAALTIDYGVVVTGKTDDSYDTSAAKTVSIPTEVSHISRGNLTVTHNGASSTYDPASASTIALSHSTLTATYGATSGQSGSVAYNTNGDKSITIPTCVNHLNRHTVKFQSGSVSAFTNQTYDPGNDCANSAETVYIPTSIDHLAEWNGTCFTIPHNLCVDGAITAGGAIYSTSDERKKEDIRFINQDDMAKVKEIPLRSFSLKEDPYHKKLYGVIAQDLLKANLGEMVNEDERGMYSVDYTSLMILKIASLENEVFQLNDRIKKLEELIDNKN